MSATPSSDRSRRIARRMTAVEQLRAEKKVRRLVQLLVGLAGYGVSLTVLLHSVVGLASWNVLADGIAHRTGLTFGQANIAVSVAVLLFWIPLRELPGLGTVANAVLVGLFADAVAPFIPLAEALPERIGYFVVGLLLMALSGALYLGSRFGAGPRDGLMTGAMRLTDRPVWLVRGTIEIVVVLVGWLLGGALGIGTLVIAATSGPLLQLFLRFTTVSLRSDVATAPSVNGD